MVSSTTTFTEETLELLEPQESMMYEYAEEGFSRRNFRYEFADSINIGLHDEYVKEGDQSYIDPDTWENPHGPSGMGEVGGSGIDTFEVENGQHPTYRFTQGFRAMVEELERGDAKLAENRRKVAETFDFFADSCFFTGISDNQGNQLRPGMFQWLKSNIDDSLTFDLSQYTSGGTETDYVTPGLQENIIKHDAYGNISGRTNDAGNWSVAMGRQKALSHLNTRAVSDGGTTPRESYWERLTTSDDMPGAQVGIDRLMLIPDELKFFETPPGYDDITIDLTNYITDDELLILPNMDSVKEHYWRLRQMPAPRMFDPIQERGGHYHMDYAWRYSHSFLPNNRYDGAEDSVHLTNVSDYFVPA